MSEDIEAAVRTAVYPVLDPHMGISIVDMGLLQEVNVEGEEIEIVLKPTNPACMSVTRIAAQVKELASNVDGVETVKIRIIDHAMADAINEMINQ